MGMMLMRQDLLELVLKMDTVETAFYLPNICNPIIYVSGFARGDGGRAVEMVVGATVEAALALTVVVAVVEMEVVVAMDVGGGGSDGGNGGGSNGGKGGSRGAGVAGA
jgi:hypothetical protein